MTMITLLGKETGIKEEVICDWLLKENTVHRPEKGGQEERELNSKNSEDKYLGEDVNIPCA